MATIVLQAAGAFIGGALGTVGSAIGSAAGAVAGYMIDRAVINSTKRYEGPRLSAARPLTAEDGAPLPRVYGTVRVGGTLIWATRFEERSTTTRQGGKGGPKVTTYSYFANAAFALCEGEVAGVRRIWADGTEIDRDKVEVRIYRGTHDQPVDPLIEAKQGSGNAPAYRGTAYVVIDNFPIEDYGRRIPQFQFEVMRVSGELNDRVRSVALIPGSTEYGLSPALVKYDEGPGKATALNRHMRFAASNLEASLDELQMLCPNLETVALVVAWFGSDLRAGECKIRPKVTQSSPRGFSKRWRVSGIDRWDAELVSLVEDKAAYGGTPTDESVMAAIAAIRQRGLKVGLYPFIMMDIPYANGLPDPYGGAEQAAYPWRGRVTCHPAAGMPETVDKSAAARTQLLDLAGIATASDFAPSSKTVAFNGNPNEWSYRRFLLHYAHLAAAAGGVETFLIGSELRGLTTVRDEQDLFPFVEVLEALAGEVRTVLGSSVITYAADWSEYFGYHPSDGTGDVFFYLDSLWAHPDIDAVGIDYYMPLADWRDTDFDGSNPDGFSGPYDLEALARGLVSGEGYDWYYASAADRAARVRLPIGDGAYGKDWVFRYKDLVNWWSSPHFNRVGGVEETEPTAWVPRSKPIHLTELGCAAMDKGPNQPNSFPDPKSYENAVPHFSNGGRSDLAQYRLLLAHYRHWGDGGAQANPISPIYGGPMLDVGAICLWAWDARPFPAFPLYGDVWSDGENWSRGHWLNGRLGSMAVSALINAILADHGLPAAESMRADGVVSGYLVSDPTTARAALEPVVALFGLGVREEKSGLVFATEGATAEPALPLDDLVVDVDRETVERTRTPDNDLPAFVHLDFRDVLNDHQSATAAVSYVGAKGNGTSFMSFPGAFSTAEANGLVRDVLRRSWDGRERAQFAVALNEQQLGPGSVVRLPDADRGVDYLVTEVEEGLTRMIKARRIVRVAPAPALGAEIPLRRAGEESFAVGKPHALFLDLPMRSAEDLPHEQLRIAAHMEPWRNQAVFVSPEETGFSPRTALSRRAVIGELTEPLAPGKGAGRIDRTSTVLVKLYSGELQSVSWIRLFNGANAAAVRTEGGGWEILQFAVAEEVDGDLWRLSGLLRGQLGTEDLMAAGAHEGASFVLLDGAVEPAGLKPQEIGLALNWRVGPAGYDLSGEHFALSTLTGGLRALLPLSPAHLKGRLDGGDLHLSWTRRSRLDADSWLAEEIPLGEVEELYRVEIAPVDGIAVRSATTSQQAWTYSAAMAAADFSVPPPAVDVTLRQMSNAIGPGLPLKRTVAFT